MSPSHSPSYLDDCLRRSVIFFTGKGGVGKSTLAVATALACVARGAKVTLAQWSPYEDSEAPSTLPFSGVRWLPLETLGAFREYALHIVKFEKLYEVVFDNRVLKTFIKAAPGLSETVIAGKLWDTVDNKEQDLLIVDLPSSGHTLSFFQSPLGIQKIFQFGFVNENTKKICRLFSDPKTRLDLVTLPEELPVTECAELKTKLEKMHPFHFGFLHVNQCTPKFSIPSGFNAKWSRRSCMCLERYRRLERREEEEALTPIGSLGLPTQFIPRFGVTTQLETIEQTRRALEGK